MQIQNIIIVLLKTLCFVTSNNINIEKKEIPLDSVEEFQRLSRIAEDNLTTLENSAEIKAENTRDKILQLKNKREDLFKNITKGIDESVAILRETNNSNALVKDLIELKDDIEKLNAAHTIGGLDNDTRRLSKLHNYMKRLPRDKQIRIKKDRQLVQEKASQMFKKLTEESEKREERKKVLRTGGERRRALEKCPRYGVRGPSRYGAGDDDDGKDRREGTKYPCCRKCCKLSYMGCL